MDFNVPHVSFGQHSIDRLERISDGVTRDEARKILQDGEVVLQTDNHKYIKKDNIVFPVISGCNDINIVRTVLTTNMVITGY